MNTNLKESIRLFLETIALCELDKEQVKLSDAGYINQRALISSLFKGEYNHGQIILRLTVIDSLYSTNASYSYFSFEEMADKILTLGTQQQARDYYYSLVQGDKDTKGLFSEKYGIQKNLSEGTQQMSLMSKYVFYELLQDPQKYPLGFPIYDRLAKEAYPTVRKMLGEKDYYSMPQLGTPTIEQYIMCLSQLRKTIFMDEKLFLGRYQQYDILDAYLWRMGKFSTGNLSLLLGRQDYIQFIKNLGLVGAAKKDKNDKFDFNQSIIDKFLDEKTHPFNHIEDDKYLSALLKHWRVFIQYKDIAPKRGIPFPN